MKVLITRPNYKHLSDTLSDMGFSVLSEPMLSIEFYQKEVAELLKEKPTVLITSANGIRAFSKTTNIRDLPIITVGDTTKQVAEHLGFKNVTSANGNVDDLIRYVELNVEGSLLHISGADTTGSLCKTLSYKGFSIKRAVLYKAHSATSISEELKISLIDKSIDTALFYSPRTAKTFISLVQKTNLTDTLKHINAFCLSKVISDCFPKETWKNVYISDSPTEKELLSLVGKMYISL